MPTISGMRRRGYTPEAIRNFCRARGRIENQRHHRTGAARIFRARGSEQARAARDGRAAAAARGDRQLSGRPGRRDGGGQQSRGRRAPGPALFRSPACSTSSRTIFAKIRRSNISASSPGREVRLRYGYFITCTGVVKDANGEVIEIHCTYDPATRGGNAPDGRKVKSTIHWVSAAHAIDAEVRLYETLFTREDPERSRGRPGFHRESESEFARDRDRRKLEPSLARRRARRPLPVRAPRLFLRSIRTARPAKPVFNRTVALRDTWAKIEKKSK